MENINTALKRLDSSNRKIVKECLQLKDVPRFASYGELKEYIGEKIEETDFDFGYFGPPRRTRFNITSNTNLAEPLSLEKRGWVVLWTTASSGALQRGRLQRVLPQPQAQPPKDNVLQVGQCATVLLCISSYLSFQLFVGLHFSKDKVITNRFLYFTN